jgi:phosphate transport system ATP-binding protein
VGAALAFEGVGVRYGAQRALEGVSLTIPKNSICVLLGAANAGKSSLLKCINRTLELVPGAVMTGTLRIDGVDTAAIDDVLSLRRRVGMVQPLPVGLPMSVYDNVAYAPRSNGLHHRADLDVRVERALRQAQLWDEVKDRLDLLGTRLSGGQQQRLTLARALSMEPEVLCLDSFSIAIDPLTTMKIEEGLAQLKASVTVVVATHLVRQAHRLADQVAFFDSGKLLEAGEAHALFAHPREAFTQRYLSGEIG